MSDLLNYQPTSDTVYTSIHYNLKQICPRLLEFKDSYLLYHNEIYLFSNYDGVLKDLNKIPVFGYTTSNEDMAKNSALYSNYLCYNVFMSYFKESYVVVKDMEEYYKSHMMVFLRKRNMLRGANMNIAGHFWYGMLRTMNHFKEKAKKYEYHFPHYEVYYSDNEHNFKDVIPLVGVNKDESVSLTYFMMTNDTRGFITGSYVDLIRVPSVCKVLLFFYKNGIKVNDIDIIWFTSGDAFKFYRFASATYKNLYDKEFMDYIYGKYDINPRLVYTTNLNKCYTCPYWDECTKKRNFLKLRTEVV